MVKYKSISVSLIGALLFSAILLFSTLIWLGNGRISLAAPTAATLYVNAATGNDGNDCLSAGAACATIGDALGKAALNDTIEIAAGVYSENLVVQDVTLNGAGAVSTILDGTGSGRTLETTGVVTVSGMTIRNGSVNSGTIGGGGILNSDTLLLQDTVVTENSTTNDGGGIFNNGILILDNSELSNNMATDLGGGLYNASALTVTNSVILGNSANRGGGIYSLATINLSDSLLQGNSADVIGGGLVVGSGTAVLNNITIYQNTAVSYGAGILNNGGVLTMSNSTVSDNTAGTDVGVANIGPVQATILNSTIAYNNISNAGGTLVGGVANNSGGTLTIKNSIVAQNDGRQCVANDNWSSDGNNLSSDTFCDFTATGDMQSTDPLLAPLADYGGSTLTHALNPGSPAIDAGNNVDCPATDQRGVSRPVDGDNDTTAVCDIGAFEARNQLTIADLSVTEGDVGTTDAVFTMTLSPASSQSVTVNYGTVDGTAVAGDDYLAASGQITFDPGQTSRAITVSVNGDIDDEPDETFTVTLSSPSNADIIDGEAIGTIVDDDGFSALTISDESVQEGDSGTTTAIFTVSLSPAVPTATVTVDYITANGVALAGVDYLATNGQLSFAPNETSKTIEVTVNGDDTDEGTSETFVVNLSNATNASIVDGQGTGTITDDDTAVISITPGPTLTEGNSGSQTAVFTVTLNNPASYTITVDYATEDGLLGSAGADAGSDYAAKSGTLTFDPGIEAIPITITVYGDADYEPDESFGVRITNGNPATIIGFVAYANIINDDDPQLYLPFIVR